MLENQGISKEITFFSGYKEAYRPDNKQAPLVDVLGFKMKPKPITNRTRVNASDIINMVKTNDFEKKDITARQNNLIKNNDKL